MMDPDDEDSEVGLGKFRSLHAKLSRRYVELSPTTFFLFFILVEWSLNLVFEVLQNFTAIDSSSLPPPGFDWRVL